MIPSFLTGLFFGGRALKRKADESGVSAWFRGALGSIFNKYTGAGLTGAEEATNKFNAEQAQIQRDWETEMSNTAMQRQVSDMQKAGLNPALMYGGAGSSGASTPSGASASGVAPTSGFDPISAILDMALLKAQVENIKADTREKESNANRNDVEANRTEMLTQAELDNLIKDLDVKDWNISRQEASIDLDYANIALLDIDAETRSQFNQIQLDLAELDKDLKEETRKEITQRVENLKREFAISFAIESAHKASAGKLSQETKNLLVENGILKENERTAKAEANIKVFEDNKKAVDRVFNNVATGAAVFRDAGIGVGAVVGGIFKGAVKGATEKTERTISKIYGADGSVISKTSIR